VALLGLSPLGSAACGLLVLFGGADIVNQVVGTTLLQEATPPLLGRVFAAFEATLVSAAALGAVGVGPLIAAVGPRAAAVLVAVVSRGAEAYRYAGVVPSRLRRTCLAILQTTV
jgi:hypothetical protein